MFVLIFNRRIRGNGKKLIKGGLNGRYKNY